MDAGKLKPCPFCGSVVNVSEYAVECGDINARFKAKIECGCGLTFEREWVRGAGCLHIPGNWNIVKAWNTRVSLDEEGVC